MLLISKFVVVVVVFYVRPSVFCLVNFLSLLLLLLSRFQFIVADDDFLQIIVMLLLLLLQLLQSQFVIVKDTFNKASVFVSQMNDTFNA